MGNQNPASLSQPNEQREFSAGVSTSRPGFLKRPFFIGVFLILILILVGGLFYSGYFPKLLKLRGGKEIISSESAGILSKKQEEGEWLDQPLFYQGLVKRIDFELKKVVLERTGLERTFQYQDGEEIFISSYYDETLPIESEPISFEEIRVGDIVAYNPAGAEFKREKAIWLVQRK